MAKVNPVWLISKSPGDLKAQIRYAVQFGYHPASQDATTAHLVRKKKFSCLIATLSLLCYGVGFLIYLFYYLAKRDDEIYLDLTTQPTGDDLKKYIDEDNKKRNRTRIIVGLVLFFFVILPIFSLIGASMSENASPTGGSGRTQSDSGQATTGGDTDFQTLARSRFDDIEQSWKENGGELNNIECFEGDCTSVIYFHFNTVPDDIDAVTRGNAATFSKFKLDNTGTSHVTIFAVEGNGTIMKCDAAGGVVSSCE